MGTVTHENITQWINCTTTTNISQIMVFWCNFIVGLIALSKFEPDAHFITSMYSNFTGWKQAVEPR